jgi:CheY-like chemotaxis protein
MLTKERHSGSFSDIEMDSKNHKARYAVLIDDDEITNFVNKDILIEMSAASEVIAFEEAGLALAFFKSDKFRLRKKQDQAKDIIFLDINMPHMNGFEFLENFRKIYQADKTVLILMLGTQLNVEGVEQIEHYKDMITQFQEKPLTKNSIIGIVNRYI